MARRTLAVLALAVLTAACAGRPRSGAQTPVAYPQSLEIPSLLSPGVDSATLDSLSTLLARIAGVASKGTVSIPRTRAAAFRAFAEAGRAARRRGCVVRYDNGPALA